MRETRLSGSEGGGAEANRLSLPPIPSPLKREPISAGRFTGQRPSREFTRARRTGGGT